MWLFRRRPAAPSVPTSELVRLRDELAAAQAMRDQALWLLSAERKRADQLAEGILKADNIIARLQAAQQKQPRDAAGRFVRVVS